MMGVRSGTEVLYVGDHIYGDILRSKKVRGEGGGCNALHVHVCSIHACLWCV